MLYTSRSEHLGVDALLFLEIPGDDRQPKTSVSVSIWNFIYYIVLASSGSKISFLMILIMLCHTCFCGTAFCSKLTLVLRSLIWLI